MFRPVATRKPKFPGLTERMVGDDGTSISLLQIHIKGPWIMEYLDPSLKLKFGFWAYRNPDFETNPIAPPKDYWTVPFTYWYLVRAIHVKRHLDPAELARMIQAKVTEALLAWPLDEHLNTIQAAGVRFQIDKEPAIAAVVAAVDNARRQTASRRRRHWTVVIVALVIFSLFMRWARQNL